MQRHIRPLYRAVRAPYRPEIRARARSWRRATHRNRRARLPRQPQI